MAIEDCLTAIKAASGGRLNDEEATELLDRAMSRAASLKSAGTPGLRAMIDAARAEGDAERMAAAIERRNKLINFRARQWRRGQVEKNAFDGAGTADNPDFALASKNMVVSVNTVMDGSRFSAEREWKDRSSDLIGGMTTELQQAGLYKTVKRGDLERQWARELAELNTDGGKPGISGNRQAQKIAEIINRWQAAAKDGVNSVGGWIGDYMGYVTRTQHDMDMVRRMKWEGWRDLIMSKLDHDRTFAGVEPADRESWLRHIYNELSQGVHLSDSRVGWKDAAFSGPGNRARSVSQDRILHFRDADAWYDYNKATSSGSLIQQMVNSFDRSARQQALMTRWGTNPRAEFEQDFKYLEEKYLDKYPDQIGKLRDSQRATTMRFDYLDGTANMPVNSLAAKVLSYARLTQSMSHLGSVMFTHLSAGAFKTSEAAYRGVPMVKGYANFFKSLAGRPEGSDLLRAGMEGMHRELISRFDINDTMPGKMASLANTFFRWGGLSYMMNAQKAGMETMLARHLGSLVETEFDRLPMETQRALRIYDISPTEWDALRQAPGHPEIDGRPFLTPDAATRSTVDMTDRARDRLGLKLHSYYADGADRAVVTPGIEERALIMAGAQPGTFPGEVMRTVMQFKTWPLAAVRQAMFRDIRGSSSVGEAALSMVNLVAATMVMGTGINAAIDTFKGLNPRPLNDPRTWIAGLMKGGGLGILGDFLFGEYNRFDQTFAESLLGPIGGTLANTLMDVWNKAKGYAVGQIGGPEQKLKSLPSEIFNTVINNTPFINLFYTRAALNYMLFWRIQEWLNPGALQRMEQRRKQRTGQTYWLSPQSAIH